MFNLLQWLWDRANRVYTLFGWLYNRIYDAALNAWNWAVDRANAAYNAAKWWIDYFYDRAIGYINNLRMDAWRWILDTWGRITSQINAALGDAWTWVQETWIKARDWAIVQARYAIDFARDLFTDAWEGLKALINGVAAVADALFERALQWAVELFQQINTELAGVREMLGLNNPDTRATLIGWITNPIGTLAAYLKLIFMAMLQYSVAYSMGTIKYTLPPWPDFSFGTGDVPIPRPDPPPPGPSGLVPPLSSIRVSGHTYGPGHPGIDLGLSRGQAVYAMHSGVIKSARWDASGYGRKVDLQGSEWWTRYAHLDGYLAPEGTQVNAGDPIATGNSTGNSTGDHLHLEIKRYGSYIDPVTVL